MNKKAITVFPVLCMMLAKMPTQVFASALSDSEASPRPFRSTTCNSTYHFPNSSYSYWNCSSPSRVYLYEEEDALTRVECGKDFAVIETYDEDFRLQSSQKIRMELPIWGGFSCGDRHNFLMFGQENEEEEDSKEVIRVVKYSKQWERLGQTSLSDINTTRAV